MTIHIETSAWLLAWGFLVIVKRCLIPQSDINSIITEFLNSGFRSDSNCCGGPNIIKMKVNDLETEAAFILGNEKAKVKRVNESILTKMCWLCVPTDRGREVM